MARKNGRVSTAELRSLHSAWKAAFVYPSIRDVPTLIVSELPVQLFDVMSPGSHHV
jgi:hypothetical protein